MKRFITSAFIASYAIAQPVNASEILPPMQWSENPAQLIEHILCPSGVFSADEARRFIFQLKSEVKAQHGIDLDLHFVIDEAIRTMVQTGQFSEIEIATAREFYAQVIEEAETEMKVCNSWLSGKKKHKDKSTIRRKKDRN